MGGLRLIKDVFGETPEGQVPRLRTGCFNIEDLKRGPEYLAEEVKSLIKALRKDGRFEDFFEAHGFDQDWLELGPQVEPVVQCREIDDLIEVLRGTRDIDHCLHDSLADRVEALRTQIVGLLYYTCAFYEASFVEDAEIDGFEKYQCLYEEMMNGEKFGRPITPRYGIYKFWFGKCKTWRQYHSVYEKMKAVEQKHPGEPPRRLFFLKKTELKSWMYLCNTEEDFSSLYEIVKYEGGAILENFFEIAYSTLDSPAIYKVFFSFLKNNRLPAPDIKHFFRYVQCATTFDDIIDIVEFLLYFQVPLVISLGDRICGKKHLVSGEKYDARAFFGRLHEMFRRGEINLADAGWSHFRSLVNGSWVLYYRRSGPTAASGSSGFTGR